MSLNGQKVVSNLSLIGAHILGLSVILQQQKCDRGKLFEKHYPFSVWNEANFKAFSLASAPELTRNNA